MDRRGGHRAHPPAGSKSSRKRQRHNRKTHGPSQPPARSRELQPPAPTISEPSESIISQILRLYHQAPFGGRPHTPLATAWPVDKSDLAGHPIATSLFPPEVAYVGQLLFLGQDPTTSLIPIQNFYLNNVYSLSPSDKLTFEIYWMLTSDTAPQILRSALT